MCCKPEWQTSGQYIVAANVAVAAPGALVTWQTNAVVTPTIMRTGDVAACAQPCVVTVAYLPQRVQ